MYIIYIIKYLTIVYLICVNMISKLIAYTRTRYCTNTPTSTRGTEISHTHVMINRRVW